MKDFTDGHGNAWVATVTEEDTPRHHGRWYLVFHPAGAETPRLPVPEVRWQTEETAERTLATMSLFELRRRLSGMQRRAGAEAGAEPTPWIHRNISAG